MDYNLETSDPNKISNIETDNIQSSNLVYTSLLRACEEADANYFDVQSTAVAAKDDLSILWNDQTQTHSKLMDTNLDDIEMNDELLDKLVTAMLQNDTLDLHTNSEASNQPAQSQLSCNHETQDSNLTSGVSDNTLQIWLKLLDGDNTVVELPQMKSITNSSINPRSAPQTPRPFVNRISEDTFHRRLTRTRSQLITASTPHKEFPETHFEVSSSKSSSSISSFAKREKISRTNSINQESCSTNSCSPESPLTSSSGPMTRSRSASKASQSDSHVQLTKTSDSNTRYYLRARSSASSQYNANLSSSQSRNFSNICQRIHKDNSTPSHEYQTRSRTSSNKTKVKATDRCCTKLAVVVQRVRMSMIARLRCRRSSIWLPTPQKKLRLQRLASSKTKLEPLSSPTTKKKLLPRRLAMPKTRVEPQRLSNPKKRLQPRRLSLRKTRISSNRKSSRHTSWVRKR